MVLEPLTLWPKTKARWYGGTCAVAEGTAVVSRNKRAGRMTRGFVNEFLLM
jgi:hypothetical protein